MVFCGGLVKALWFTNNASRLNREALEMSNGVSWKTRGASWMTHNAPARSPRRLWVDDTVPRKINSPLGIVQQAGVNLPEAPCAVRAVGLLYPARAKSLRQTSVDLAAHEVNQQSEECVPVFG